MVAANMTALLGTFITALHILHDQNVFDAYGHLSLRNPANASTFFMSRNVAPALVASPADIVEYRVADASAVDPAAPAGFIERFIHSAVLARFSNVSAVVHSHSPAVIPFSIAGVPLRASISTAGFLGTRTPVFDIAEFYQPGDVQDLLVRTQPLGAALAGFFSDQPPGNGTPQANPDHAVVLMANHGFTTAAASLDDVLFQAVYTTLDASVQSSALMLKSAFGGGGGGSGLRYLDAQEAAQSWTTLQGTVARPLGLWTREVEVDGLYVSSLDPNQTSCLASDGGGSPS